MTIRYMLTPAETAEAILAYLRESNLDSQIELAKDGEIKVLFHNTGEGNPVHAEVIFELPTTAYRG